MDIVITIIITLGILYWVGWGVTYFLGWTPLLFTLVTIAPLLVLFSYFDFEEKRPQKLRLTVWSLISILWIIPTLAYWFRVVIPLTPFSTFSYLAIVTIIPIVFYYFFEKYSKVAFILFIVLLLFGTKGMLVFPNDLSRWEKIERHLAPIYKKTEEIMAVYGDDSQYPENIYKPNIIIEKKDRTPYPRLHYSIWNLSYMDHFPHCPAESEIKTAILVIQYYTTDSTYQWTSRRVGSSSVTGRGTVQAHQHMCSIYLLDFRKNKKFLYKIIKGPSPEKPTGSFDSWGKRVDQNDISKCIEEILI